MKKLLTFTNVVGAAAMVWGLAACSTTASTTTNTSQKETMLTQAGFISKTVTTPKQKEQVEKLTVGVVSAVKCKGKLLYVYPTEKKDQVLYGKQAQYDAYKKMLAAKTQSSAAAQTQMSADNGAYLTGETAGPNRIIVQEFDGFGPLPDSPAWQ